MFLGNCLDVLKTLPDNSIDSIVTDPPYGLSFMGKKWDYDVPSIDIWKEALRVLKPGGHLLSFGGTRTYHRMVVNIEDAGFEIRDQVQWLYGSGFPKSLNIGKAIDKQNDVELEIVGKGRSGSSSRAYQSEEQTTAGEYDQTKSNNKWSGWGTALKPANEPICLARKPLEKGLTIAENVVKWGCGAINVDASRIELSGKRGNPCRADGTVMRTNANTYCGGHKDSSNFDLSQGRWPANIILDEDAAAMLDEQSIAGGIHSAGKARNKIVKSDYEASSYNMSGARQMNRFDDGNNAGASRFFYVAKASKKERNAGLDSKDLIWESDVWLKPDLNSLMVNIKQLQKDISEDITTDESKWSIELFGNQSTDQCQPALMFTILTALKLIIESKTSNVFQNSITRENIQDVIRTIETNGLSLAESVASISQLIPSITDEKTAFHLGVVHALLKTLLKIKGFAKSQNFHSTVKPIKLMEYLIKLVTPSGGAVLDPFMGSGSTGVAAKNLGFEFIGIEMNEEYFNIAEKRIG